MTHGSDKPVRLLAGNLALALIYFAAGKLGLALAYEHVSVTLVWPPTGIALAANLLLGPRVWPGIFLGAFAVNVTPEGHVAEALGIALGNTLEAYVGARLIARFAGGVHVFEQPKGVLAFLFLAGLGNTVSATVGVGSLALAGNLASSRLAGTWITWWLGDTTGALLLTPALVLWFRDHQIHGTGNRAFMAGLLFSLLLALGIVVFGDVFPLFSGNYNLSIVFLPILIWIAFQFGPREAASATLLLATIAIAGTLSGHGPFFQPESPHASLLILQTFLGITGVTTLLFAGLAHGLQQTRLELEQRVTERTMALERAHKRFRDLVESAPDAEVIVNEQGRIVLVNAQTERLFGFRRDQLLDQPVEILIPERLHGAHRAHRDQFHAHPESRPMGAGLELLGMRQDGREFPIEISLSPLATDEGLFISAAIRDISQRREIEKRLRQSERLAAVGEMISGLAHESRNALQRTSACLELLMLRVQERPDLLALAQDIQKAQDFLLQLYQEVQTYAAPVKLRRENVDVGKVLQETWRQLEQVRKRRAVRLVLGPRGLEKEVPALAGLPIPPSSSIWGDSVALGHVFRNVLENALSACPDPVVLRVTWSDTRLGTKPAIEVSFVDNGPGFATDTLGKIFQPFFSTKTQGTGLGLAIAKRIVEAHDGRIEVGRNGLGGAEILLTLPREKP